MQKGNTVIIIEEFMQDVLGLSGAELMVYAVMYSFCKLSGSFYAAVCYLASRVRVSERAVQYALGRLIKRGYIKRCGKHEMYGTFIYECTPIEVIKAEKAAANEALLANEPTSTEASEPTVPEVRERSAAEGAEKKKAPPPFEEWKAEYYAYYIAEGLGEKMKGPPPMSYSQWQAAYDAYYGGTPDAIARERALRDTDASALDGARFMRFGIEGVVRLTDVQYEALCESIGEEMAELYILRLEDYILNHPHFRSHSHYKTILKWIKEDAELDIIKNDEL